MERARRDQIHTLTGLRAFAAYWVVLLHTCHGKVNDFPYLPGFDDKVNFGFLQNIIYQGHYAVDIFFILSGFVIYHAYGELFKTNGRHNIFKYYASRLARIYPLHLFIAVVLGVLFFSNLWQPDRPVTPNQFIASALLANVWINPSLNIPAWSVSAEFFAYLIFPLIIRGIMSVKSRLADMLAVMALAIIYGVGIEYMFGMIWHYGAGAVFRSISGFIVGCFLYNFYSKATQQEKSHSDLYCMFLIVLLAIVLTLRMPPLFIYPILAFLVLNLASCRGFIHKIFANRVSIYLGVISYSVYMVHYPVLELYRSFFNKYFESLDRDLSQPEILFFLMAMLLSVTAAAAFCYHFVEHPARAFVKKRLDKG